jgi:RHS repeat-associated protein
MGNYTVYVNPYIVLKSGGYTKHYYIEGQRIVSKLGGDLSDATKSQKAGGGKINYPDKQEGSREGIVRNLKWLGQDGALLTAGNSGKTPPGQVIGEGEGGGNGNGGGNGGGGKDNEKFQYFYHPDHLGSSSYITDASGEVYQHLEYFAFGETFVEEHSNTQRTPYLFNGKELDEETGLYYYGARYYDAQTSVWLAVDPMAEKFAGWSAYNYTFNNPIAFVDPDGKEPKPPKVILVFYHGGPFGQGQIKAKSNDGTGYTGKIYEATYNFAKSQGREVKGAIIAPSATQSKGVATGKKFLKDNYNKGDQVIIYGYSYGGDNAVNLAEEARDLGMPVNTMIIVDSSDGPGMGTTVDSSVPENTDFTLNVYQTEFSGDSSGSQLIKRGSSDGGSFNSPGSRGNSHSAEGNNPVINRDLTGKGVTHGNSQQRANDIIQPLLNTRIHSYEE